MAPTLVLHKVLYDFVVCFGASISGFRVVLMHRVHVISYDLRQLKPHEANYPKHDLRLAGMVFSLKIWIHYLYRVSCTMYTNHKSLMYLVHQPNLNMWQWSCLDVLKDCDCEIL